MVGFKVLSDINDGECRKLPISSQTLAPGDLVEQAAGTTTWSACTAATSSWTRKAIAMETVTSSATECLAYMVTGNELVEVQVANTVSAADNGDRMILTDKNTVNNTHSDDTSDEACFIQEKPGSSTTSAIGYIVVGTGVDWAAT